MTLRQRFKQWLDTDPRYQIRDVQLEVIAEDFAIRFVDWCKQEYDVENTPFHNKWLNVDGEYVSTKELLQIYKKEKGL